MPPRIRRFADSSSSSAEAPPSFKLTKYETAHVVGLRAEMIARGAQAMVEVGDVRADGLQPTAIEIAKRELEARRMPLIVERTHPDGRIERLRLAAASR
jgi:DNA-directed RNA polymerase subunit K/omega